MINILILLLLFMLILMLMLLINFMLFKNKNLMKNKSSPFECGFEYMLNNRLPFSLQFFLIALIFLIFDIEIALILPMVKLMNYKFMFMIINIILILLILLIGLIIEWLEGALNWLI